MSANEWSSSATVQSGGAGVFFRLEEFQEFVVEGVIDDEFLRFGDGFVFRAVVVGEVEDGLFFDERGQDVRDFLVRHGHVGFHAALVIDGAAVLGLVCHRQ